MEIILNNDKESLKDESTLLDLMTAKKLHAANGIALAVNDEVIGRTQWESYKLKEKDRVLIIIATQGG